MQINHDTRCALDYVVDLLNTAADGSSPDTLVTSADLHSYLERNNVSGVGSTLGEQDLSGVRAVRDTFTRIFEATDTRTAAGLLNDLVAEAGTTPQLTDHDGYDWHVHYFAPDATVAQHLAADGGMALAFIVVAGERDRLRRCGAPDCGRAFIDLSRNRSRRYCDSRTCGNRLHVAAYRARRRELAEPEGRRAEAAPEPRDEGTVRAGDRAPR
ncbi:CGNR zinc finger domain-containing protein [Streptomyces sp. AJS327]|uniref:CGNR zinc finger domain-containing protein n=1 Tax=Streptomyces sp. AJS327 TaxID=2545265 RepID=UPI0015DF3D3B|nr:CGNR zinc finger domain-containing protein [Streptomyces sp. AJS327]MBA0050774.1 CGNR zinc finger domain-containing protein [Streptomyces sp. AJS327]